MRRYRERKRLERASRDHVRVLPFEPFNQLPARADDPAAPKVDNRPYEIRFQEWAEAELIVPVGLRAGKPFRLMDWQVDFVRQTMRAGIRESGLSIARKNGKSALIGALLLFELVEMRRPGWRAVVASVTGELAKELRRQVEGLRDASGITGIRIMRSPQPGRVESVAGGEVTFLAADKATGVAIGADVSIVDEAGLLQESRRELWDNMRTCISGRDGRFIAISIRGDGPMFGEMAERKDDAAVHWQEYAPEENAPIDSEETWRAGNPGLGEIKSLEYMRDKARFSLATPADSNAFRAFDLNLPVSPTRASIVQVDDWRKCCVESESELPPPAGPCYVGVDLGGASSLSAVAAYWPDAAGRLDVWVAAPAQPDPVERGRRDGVGMVYARAVEAGFLLLTPGRTTSVPQLLGRSNRGRAGGRFRPGAWRGSLPPVRVDASSGRIRNQPRSRGQSRSRLPRYRRGPLRAWFVRRASVPKGCA